MNMRVTAEQFLRILDEHQETQLDALAKTLTREQLLWVSGYFAARANMHQAALIAPEPTATQAATVRVLFATETGNAERVAKTLTDRLMAADVRADLQNLDNYSVRSLKKKQLVLVVTSTHGEGSPPDTAMTFFEDLQSAKVSKLPDLSYAVLALGDSSYEKFCEAGKVIDWRLDELGAHRLHPRVDCDVDFETLAEEWIDAVSAIVAKSYAGEAKGNETDPTAPASSSLTISPKALASSESPRYDRTNPFPARVIESTRVTGRGSTKQTRHIEFSLDDSGITYAPGDALGILPSNDPRTIETLLELTGLCDRDKVNLKGVETSLADALTHHVEISAARPKFVALWAEWSGSKALSELVREDNRTALRAFLRESHVTDIMHRYPVAGIDTADLLDALGALQPRLYSLASSLKACPDEAHITVGLVHYDIQDSLRRGVASGFLCERVAIDDSVPVYVQENRSFRLPSDPDIPIIMIGAGTGVAPFRAFMQERRECESCGPSWLFLGERNFRTDFLYQVEWQRLLADGWLTQMDVAFSRDQDTKMYVQHRMRERAKELYGWLRDGGHLYVCGDMTSLAPGVDAALQAIVMEQGDKSSDDAAEYIRDLQRSKRYQKDVY